MRKDSKLILGTSVLLTAAIIGGAHLYANRSEISLSIAESEPPKVTAAPSQHMEALDVSAETPSARTSEIIECHDPEIGTFYTNAATCEGADLENKISHAQELTPQLSAAPTTTRRTSRTTLAQASRQDKAPNLRLTGKAPPPGLPAECKFPVGKALETERTLSAAEDPYKSRWRETYCRFRCEAIQEECPVTDRHFSYDFWPMCRNSGHSVCGSLR